MMMNFEEYTEKELNDIIQRAEQERQRRAEKAQWDAWKNVVNAISNYTNNFGAIEISDCGALSYLDENTDLSAPGIFEMV